jgi:hypothetical protein
MDNAVALVRTYLQLNGYFTVTEYPVISGGRHGGHRTMTDLDVIAFRFPGAGDCVVDERHHTARVDAMTDPALGVPEARADMIIAEVKEGRAEISAAARNPDVIRAALIRFGCCGHCISEAHASQLVNRGATVLPVGHTARLVAFGSSLGGTAFYRRIVYSGVLAFINRYIDRHWDAVCAAGAKDPVLGLLMLEAKARRGAGASLSLPEAEAHPPVRPLEEVAQ